MSAVVSAPVAVLDAHPGMMPASGGLNRAVSEAIGGLQAAICLMQDLPDRRRNAGIGPRRERGLLQPDHKPCLRAWERASRNAEQRP